MNQGWRWFALLVFAMQIRAHAYTIDTLFQTIDAKNLNTLEEVLAELPPELRASYTLQYESHGLQGASPLSPRAILFGNDAKFVATFNGDPQQIRYNRIEVLQFNDQEHRHELYDIKFPIERDINGLAIRPVKNPQVCTSCHGSTPHPIWAGYYDDSWPGMYGGYRDDALTYVEHQNFKTFSATRESHPRYKSLLPMVGSSTDTSPYGAGHSDHFQFRPNLRLGFLFNRLNGLSLSEQLKKSPHYQRFSKLLLLTFDCQWRQELGEGFTADEKIKLAALLEPLIKAENGGVLPYPQFPVLSVQNFITLFGISVDAWMMSLNKIPELGHADLSYYDGGASGLPMALSTAARELAKQHPELAQYVREDSAVALYQNDQRLVRTQFDRDFLAHGDQIFTAVSFLGKQEGDKNGCPLLTRIVAEELLN